MNKPLTPEDISTLRRYHQPCGSECGPRARGEPCLTARWLATLDAARSATPSSKEAEQALNALEREVRWQARNGAPGLDPMAGLNRRALDALFARLRAALATPDNAGRSSIEKEAASADAGGSPVDVELRAAIRRFLTIDDALPEKRDGSEWEDRPTEDWDAALREWREARDDLDARLSESTGSEGPR